MNRERATCETETHAFFVPKITSVEQEEIGEENREKTKKRKSFFFKQKDRLHQKFT